MKSIKNLDISELRAIVQKCAKVHKGCSGISCDDCVSNRFQYEELQEMSMSCTEVWNYLQEQLEIREKDGKPENPYEPYGYKDTYDTIIITPENTSLKYLIETGYVHVLAEVLEDGEGRDSFCRSHGCETCKLHQRNFSKELGSGDCRAPANSVILISKLLKQGYMEQQSTSDTCENCQNLVKGDYLFCKAWGNFTTAEMYCGYHKPIDK